MQEKAGFGTIQDVARLANVSAMTVSRAINTPELVSDETRKRVEAAIEAVGYVPNALARGMLQGRTKTIAVMLSSISNPFQTLIARGIEDVLQRNGYLMFLGSHDDMPEKEFSYLNAALSKRADGVLIIPTGNTSRRALHHLVKRDVPFVMIDHDVEGLKTDMVMGDSVAGARMLVHHLLSLGHQRIALVNGPLEKSTARERLQGYEEQLREAGIAVRPELVIESNYRRDGGYQSARKLLSLPAEQRPTAIFAANNLLAIGVIEALREAGLSVPRDMALVCFDDIEIASALYPFLTVAAQPAYTFGTIAAQFLVDRLQGMDAWRPRKAVLPPELLVRLSCGATLGLLASRES